MKLLKTILILIPMLILSCTSDWEKAKMSIKRLNEESTAEQTLIKCVTIEVFSNQRSIGSCLYIITMTQTVIGTDSIWVVSDVDPGVSVAAGFHIHSSPEELTYVKTIDGYDIHLTLECQISDLESQLEYLAEDGISFIHVYDGLNDNYISNTGKDSVAFKGKGFSSTTGNHITLIKQLRIHQEHNHLTFEQDELEITLSSGYDGPDHQFLESNEFPKRLEFEKSAGLKPLKSLFH